MLDWVDGLAVFFTYGLDVEIAFFVIIGLYWFSVLRRLNGGHTLGIVRSMCVHHANAIIGVLIGEMVCEVVKHFVVSERPDADFCIISTNVGTNLGNGMPSSHSELAAVLFIASFFILDEMWVCRLFQRWNKQITDDIVLTLLILIGVLSTIINFGVFWSRIQLGCHTPQQVLVGASIGAFESFVSFFLIKKLVICGMENWQISVLEFVSRFVPRFITGNYITCFISIFLIGVSAGVVAHDPSAYISYILSFPLVFLGFICLFLLLIVIYDTLENGGTSYLPLTFTGFLTILTTMFVFNFQPLTTCMILLFWVFVCSVLALRLIERIHEFVFEGTPLFSAPQKRTGRDDLYSEPHSRQSPGHNRRNPKKLKRN